MMVGLRGSGFRTQLYLVGGFVALVLLGLAVLSFIAVEEQVSSDFREGVHYVTLGEPRRVRGQLPLVEEFFSYSCVHCYNLDASLDSWVASKEGKVRLERVPVTGTGAWRRLAVVYYAAEERQLLQSLHMRFFRAIHDGGWNLSRQDELMTFLRTQGVDGQVFARAMTSSSVARRLAFAEERQRQYQIASVPSLVVNGTYLVRAGREVGLARMLDIVDHLLEEMQAEDAAE